MCVYLKSDIVGFVQLHANQHQMKCFNLTVTACPPGLVLLAIGVDNEYKCQCSNNIDQNIVDCLPNQGRIILEVVSIVGVLL